MDLVRFFSGNNTVLTACEEDFKKFIKFMKSFNLLSTFNTKDENLNWNYFVHIAKLNNPNTFEGYILWEFTPDKGLIFWVSKEKSIDWYGLNQSKLTIYLMTSQALNIKRGKE